MDRRGPHDFGTGALGSGEGHQVDFRVCGEGAPDCRAATGDHIEHAGRDSGFEREASQEEGGQRSFDSRFEHDRVADRQGRSSTTSRDGEGEVPGNDQRHHPVGHPVEHRHAPRHLELLPVGLVGRLAEERQVGGCRVNVSPSLADRLSRITALDHREPVGVVGEEGSQADQRLAAVPGRKISPLALRLPCCGHCGVDVIGRAVDHSGQDLPRCRIEVVKGGAAGAACHLSIDEERRFEILSHQARSPLVADLRIDMPGSKTLARRVLKTSRRPDSRKRNPR